MRKIIALILVIGILLSIAPISISEEAVDNSNEYDFDNDGIPETIIYSEDNKMTIFNMHGGILDKESCEQSNVYYTQQSGNPLDPGVPEPQPGWPITIGFTGSSPVFENLAGDENLEIVIASNGGKVYIFDAYGNTIPNWPQNYGMGALYASSPAVGDIDGDDEPEIIIGSWMDHKIWAWNLDGTLVDGNWPITTMGVVMSSPALGDIDQDGELEIVIASYYAYKGALYALNGDGSNVDGWPLYFNNFAERTPALGDIDNDGKLEVIISCDNTVYAFNGEDATVVDGWPVELYGTSSDSALGDIDNDGRLEIIIGDASWGGYVWVFKGDGSVEDGWPIDVGNNVFSSPALADFDDDGDLEIVIATDQYFQSPIPARMFIFQHNGDVVDNWPVELPGFVQSQPIVCDMDADDELEIMIGTRHGTGGPPAPNLYAFEYDASLVNDAWPLYGEDLVSTPAVGDIDNDGMLEIAVGSTYDDKVYCWELGGNTYNPDLLPWPMFHHDKFHTGLYGEPTSPPNNPPNEPTISGPIDGDVGEEYTYTFVSTDPDDDDIASYTIDWGDYNVEVVEGPFASGEEVLINHTWSERGTYIIKVKAKDVGGAESDWETLEVTMPRNKLFNFKSNLKSRLLERFSNAFPILRQLLKL